MALTADPSERPEGGTEDGGDRSLRHLDDHADREELRARYYNLLQELRVVIPGVQVLLAFLLTVPFADRFDHLDAAGRALYGATLLSALVSVASLLTPTVLHRLGERRARRARLGWSIRLTVVGLVALAVALVLGLACVSRLVFGTGTTVLLVGAGVAVLGTLWGWLPLRLTRLDEPSKGRSPVRR